MTTATTTSHLGKDTARLKGRAGALSEQLYGKAAHPVFPIFLGADLLHIPRSLQIGLVHQWLLHDSNNAPASGYGLSRHLQCTHPFWLNGRISKLCRLSGRIEQKSCYAKAF